jgi:hypothetical protein
MAVDRSIFGLRFGSNPELTPSREELGSFLEKTFKAGTRQLYSSDLTVYGDLVGKLIAFDQDMQRSTARSLREAMFYRVLGNSQFAHPALMLAVGQYLYHLHALGQIDLRKPAAFIRAAEEEMGKLKPKRKDDAVKLARLQGMVEERKRTLDGLQKQMKALIGELRHIMVYIRDNLVRIQKLCEASIVVLVELQLSQKEEKRLIDDIRERLRERTADSLYGGADSTAFSEQDAAVLSKEMAALIRQDIYALSGLYESIHDHAADVVQKLDLLLKEVDVVKARSIDEERELFARASTVLAYLIAGHRFDLKTTEFRSETAYGDLLDDERKEMHSHLFDLLEKERRTRTERRTGRDRRVFWESASKGPERRNQKDRRTGRGRRAGLPLYSQKTAKP